MHGMTGHFFANSRELRTQITWKMLIDLAKCMGWLRVAAQLGIKLVLFGSLPMPMTNWNGIHFKMILKILEVAKIWFWVHIVLIA